MRPDPNLTPERIDALPGLGTKSSAMLAAAGITTPVQLQALGSVRACARVRARPVGWHRKSRNYSSDDSA